MLAAQRHRRILEIVHAQGSTRVSELAREFDVTEETIRRDLLQLEKNGHLIRHHGGAMSNKLANVDPTFSERHEALVEEKISIAKATLKLINPDETIFLDSSTTVLQLAKLLPPIPLTVITHSCHVLEVLRGHRHATVIATGGELHTDSNSFLGSIAERSLSQFHVDKAFMSCRSIDLSWGASEALEAAATLKSKAVEIAEKAYLLADHTKFGKRSFTRIVEMDAFEKIICDKETEHTKHDSISCSIVEN